MSVRAYKIKKIAHSESPSFNVSRDQFIVENLISNEQLNMDGCGMIELYVESVKELLEDVKNGEHDDYFNDKNNEDEPKDETIEKLEQIIKDAGKEEYVMYYCF